MRPVYFLAASGLAGLAVLAGQMTGQTAPDRSQSKPASTSTTPGIPSLGVPDISPAGVGGPDVIVGSLPETSHWFTDATETAYSIGTTSCNIGTADLNWLDQPSNLHPVIGQSMYRLLNGRFEHIGQSWLKHGFCALQNAGLCPGCSGGFGCLDHLTPGCSDPYCSSLNGTQTQLGPKWQVNPVTGVFPIPYNGGEGTAGSLRRRLRVKNVDLANAGATYFVEGQYVTQDDAAFGHQNNNASWRRVTVNSGNFDLTLQGTTAMEDPAIRAWPVFETGVTLTNSQQDGLYILGHKVTDLGGGMWHYEYAVHNLNSDRAARSFSIATALGVSITNVGFHDVDYHSGDGINGVNYSGTDWVATVGASSVTWTTETEAANINANALRWGTLYNFRFDANSGPLATNATLDFFKAGSPTNFAISTLGPSSAPCPGDCATPNDGTVDVTDLLLLFANWGGPGLCDVDGNFVTDVTDLLLVLGAWGLCP